MLFNKKCIQFTQLYLLSTYINTASVFDTVLAQNSSEINDNLKKKIEGNVMIGQQRFQATCTCKPDSKDSGGESICNPQQFRIIVDKPGGDKSTPGDIEKFIGNIQDQQWTRITETHFSCIDPRNKGLSINTPGGDIGEFILGLHVYQNSFKPKLKMNQTMVKNIMKKYIKQMRQDYFYMCTDEAATNRVKAENNMQGVDLKNPNESDKKILLEKLVEPENIGSIHQKNMMANPDMYKVDPDLIKFAIRAFYMLLWENDKECRLFVNFTFVKINQLDEFMGGLDAYAFIEIKSNATCTEKNQAPLFRNNSDKGQYWVNHIDAVQIRRAEITYFFTNVIAILDNSKPIENVIFLVVNKNRMSFSVK